MVVIKILLCVVCACYSRRRRGVLRRRAADSATVPVVENDELQREHEQEEREHPYDPPPPYTPTAEPWEGGIRNDWRYQDREETLDIEQYLGIPQGPATAPPAYSRLCENNNLAQTHLIQRTQETAGNVEEINGVPQGTATVPSSVLVRVIPPPAYPPSIAAISSENTNDSHRPKGKNHE